MRTLLFLVILSVKYSLDGSGFHMLSVPAVGMAEFFRRTLVLQLLGKWPTVQFLKLSD